MHPKVAPTFPLRLLPSSYAVARLPADATIPAWADGQGLSSITRTADELSIVCLAARVPSGVQAVRTWRAFQLVGPVPFSTTGVVSALTAPLAAAKVGVFILSTFDTDYLLVDESNLATTVATLRAADFDVRGA